MVEHIESILETVKRVHLI